MPKNFPPHVLLPELVSRAAYQIGLDPRRASALTQSVIAGLQELPGSEDTPKVLIGTAPLSHRTINVNTPGPALVLSPASQDRVYLFIQNIGAVDAFIGLEQVASSVSGILIPPGGFYEPLIIPSTAISAWSTGTMLTIVGA